MSFGYCILIAKPGACDDELAQIGGLFRNRGWKEVGSTPALSIFIAGEMPVEDLGQNRGVVLGDIFARNVPTRFFAGGPTSCDRAFDHLQSQTLHEDAWGSFIALARRSENGWRLLRSPFSTLQALIVPLEDSWMISSHIPRWLRSDALKWTVDRSALIDQLLRPDLTLHHSCLDQVQPALGGDYYDLDGGARHHRRYRPSKYCAPDNMVNSPAEAHELLRREVKRSSQTWGSTLRKPLLDLSGGLDSTIIASLAGRALDCINLHYPASDGDERRYAAVAAEYSGHELAVRTINPADVDVLRSASDTLPWPTARSFVQAGETAARDELRVRDCGAYLSGGGGDHVFSSLHSTGPVFDAIRDIGPVAAFGRVAMDVAAASESTIWHLCATFVRRALGTTSPLATDPQLLSRGAATELSRSLLHPWLDDIHGVAKGKVEHVFAILRAESSNSGFERVREHQMEFPHLTQPVVEACLRIPSWMWVAGGIDRSAVRSALSADLPPIVLSRRSKGGFTHFHRDVHRQHRSTIIDMVMGGLLRKTGALDEKALASAISRERARDPAHYLRLMRIADLEAWALGWR